MSTSGRAKGSDSTRLPIAPPPWWARFSEPMQRLWAELKRIEAELPPDTATASANDQTAVASRATDEGRRLLKAAEEALRSGHREAAWALSQDARRSLVALLTPEERRVAGVTTRHLAADKLASSARGQSVLELLKKENPQTPEALTEALLQIDIKSGNQARNDRTIRHELFLLMGVLLATTVAALVFMYLLGTGEEVSFENPRLLVLAPLFGILGASVSSIQRVSSRPTMKVPQQRAAMVANAIRLGTGAGASLVVLAGLQTATTETTVAAALLGSFAGGFSERFILRFLPDAEPEADKPSSSTGQQAAAAPSRQSDLPDSYFRAGVGIVVVGPGGKVMMIERSKKPGAFQFPQGGIKPGEPLDLAARRELWEETGMDAGALESLGPLIPEWLVYELPVEYRSAKTGMGQAQKWFLYRSASDKLPSLPASGDPADQEASSLKWVDISAIGEIAVEFRKPVYERLAAELAKRSW